MKRFLLLFILLTSLAAAQELEPINTGFAEIKLTIRGNAVGNQTVFLPTPTERQTVLFPNNIAFLEEDDFGNTFTKVTGSYSYFFTVLVDGTKPLIRKDEPFPITQTEQFDYLGNSNFIISDDFEIVSRARDITKQSQSKLEAIKDIALWVNTFITYDTSYSINKNTLSSTEILKVRRGVCSEFANLYSALARSLNIPTRIVTGMVFTGSVWQRHGWAESYVAGKWVPVDATFGEVGNMNALHVKLYTAPTYLYYLNAKSTEEVIVHNYTAEAYKLGLSVDAELSRDLVAPRDIFYLTARIKNNDDTILMPTFVAQKTVGIELVNAFRQSEVFQPQESRTLEWKFVAPYGERENYFIVLNGPLTERKFPLQIDTSLQRQEEVNFQITDVFSREIDDNIVIEFVVRNIGNRDDRDITVSVTAGDLGTQQQEIELRSGEQQTLKFTMPSKPGVHDYEITVQSGESEEFAFGSLVLSRKQTSEEAFISNIFSLMVESFPQILALLSILTIGIISVTLFLPSLEPAKAPFAEAQEWNKLLKMRQELPKTPPGPPKPSAANADKLEELEDKYEKNPVEAQPDEFEFDEEAAKKVKFPKDENE